MKETRVGTKKASTAAVTVDSGGCSWCGSGKSSGPSLFTGAGTLTLVNRKVGHPLFSMSWHFFVGRIWDPVELSFHRERFGAARTAHNGSASEVQRPTVTISAEMITFADLLFWNQSKP